MRTPMGWAPASIVVLCLLQWQLDSLLQLGSARTAMAAGFSLATVHGFTHVVHPYTQGRFTPEDTCVIQAHA